MSGIGEAGLGLDPDCRVQEVTRGIFQRFRERGSARQVHLAFKAEGVHFPRPSDALCVREVVRRLEMISHFQRGGTEG